MTRTASFVVALVLGAALVAPPAAATGGQGRGQARGQAAKSNKAAEKSNKSNKTAKKDREHGAKPAKAAKHDKRGDADVVIDRDAHARVIREYRGAGALPPGLAKRRTLPPGLRRQLAERGTLPPGLRGYFVAVPDPWAARMPEIPPYYHRYFAGDDLVVVDTRTDRIVAVVRDVLR